MSGLFFRQLRIAAPEANLGVGSGPHGAQTGAMLAGIESIALAQHPDWLLVYGDTNSTLAGALVGAKLHIPVAHVEAGLRSYDRQMPEETNRVVADHVSTLLLCPTQTAVENLAREGVVDGVRMTGDVMLDAFQQNLEIARANCEILADLGLESGAYQVLTVHRAENTDQPDRLAAIMRGVADSGLRVVFPVHPRTRAVLVASRLTPPPNVLLTDPVGYLEMLVLEENAEAILTDSGGVQKEAYFAGRRCITLRTATEWTETVEAGWNVLVGPDSTAIATALRDFHPSGERPALFGDGHAAEAVMEALTTARSSNP
jgi:UDP-N-acetylglucosamine 2-epimerase